MINIITERYRGSIKSIAEIGSAHGHDADFFAKSFHVDPGHVHIVEPRPEAAEHIRNRFPNYNVHQIACSDRNEKSVPFHISAHLEGSSLRDRGLKEEKWLHQRQISVNVWRWESFMDEHGIAPAELVKIDAEGCTFEVLQGFGRYRNVAKIYHLECEDIQFWEGQKLTEEVVAMMPDYMVVSNTDPRAALGLGPGHQKDIIMLHRDFVRDWSS